MGPVSPLRRLCTFLWALVETKHFNPRPVRTAQIPNPSGIEGVRNLRGVGNPSHPDLLHNKGNPGRPLDAVSLPFVHTFESSWLLKR